MDSFPNLQLNDLGQLQVGPDPNAPQGTIQNTYQLAEAITWTKNAHTLKFGIEGRKSICAADLHAACLAATTNTTTRFPTCRMPFPTALAERSNGNPIYYGDQSAIYWYVNDNWRIRRELDSESWPPLRIHDHPIHTKIAESQLRPPAFPA